MFELILEFIFQLIFQYGIHGFGVLIRWIMTGFNKSYMEIFKEGDLSNYYLGIVGLVGVLAMLGYVLTK
jgi:hypothetical protein